MVTKKNKEQLNITISPYIKRELDTVVGDKAEFAGYSDICTIAITQFLERYKYQRQRGNNAPTGPRTEIMDLFTSNLENQFASV